MACNFFGLLQDAPKEMQEHTSQTDAADVHMEEQSSVFFVDRQMIGNGQEKHAFNIKCKLIYQRFGIHQCLLQDASQLPKIQPPQPEEKQVAEQSSALGRW